MTSKLLFSAVLGFGLLLSVSGCSSTKSDTSESATDEHDHGDHDEGDEGHAAKTDMEKMEEALADFSEEDRKSAMKQHVCPVTGEMLGTMGKPEKVDVNGQLVWVCCDGCKDELLADPEKYLAKLND